MGSYETGQRQLLSSFPIPREVRPPCPLSRGEVALKMSTLGSGRELSERVSRGRKAGRRVQLLEEAV